MWTKFDQIYTKKGYLGLELVLGIRDDWPHEEFLIGCFAVVEFMNLLNWSINEPITIVHNWNFILDFTDLTNFVNDLIPVVNSPKQCCDIKLTSWIPGSSITHHTGHVATPRNKDDVIMPRSHTCTTFALRLAHCIYVVH